MFQSEELQFITCSFSVSFLYSFYEKEEKKSSKCFCLFVYQLICAFSLSFVAAGILMGTSSLGATSPITKTFRTGNIVTSLRARVRSCHSSRSCLPSGMYSGHADRPFLSLSSSSHLPCKALWSAVVVCSYYHRKNVSNCFPLPLLLPCLGLLLIKYKLSVPACVCMHPKWLSRNWTSFLCWFLNAMDGQNIIKN